MFFPYRAQIALHRFPIVTVAISLLCIAIYTAQSINEYSIVKSTMSFCDGQRRDRDFVQMLSRITGSTDTAHCATLLFSVYRSKNEKDEIARLAQRVRTVPGVANAEQHTFYGDILLEAYRSYRRTLPSHLSARLWYPPESWNVLRMLSASVAHGSWGHLIGNLFFFFAFAATIEILIGRCFISAY